MEREPAGNGTTPAPPRPPAGRLSHPHVDQRLLEALLAYALNATSAARPRSRSNGQQPIAPARAEGLSGVIELDPESAAGELSEPVPLGGSPPPKIEPPEESKPTHLAKSQYGIALCAIGLLAFIVVAAFVTLWRGQNIDTLTRLLEIIFAPVVAVVAAAVAFYYRG